MHVDLFKHYLELTLKVNIFYYAITGAILSFYFSRPDPLVLRWALVFPFIMSVVLAIAACYGARLNEVTRTDVQDLVGRLGLDVWPEMRILSIYLWLTAGLFTLVAAGLVLLFFFSDAIFQMKR